MLVFAFATCYPFRPLPTLKVKGACTKTFRDDEIPVNTDLFATPFISPILLQIGPFSVTWYALAYLVGILGGWIVLTRVVTQRAKIEPLYPITRELLDDFLIYAVVAVVLGGRLGYVLFYAPHLLARPIEIINFWEGGIQGMSFHGGMAGVVIAALLFSRKRKIPPLCLADLLALVTPIGIGLVRCANFINGELWGRVTDVPWAVVFTRADLLARHPSPLYEAVLEGALLLAVQLVLVRKGAIGHRGRLTGTFFLGYGLARSVAEGFREPEHWIEAFAPATYGMVLSWPLVIVGAGLLIWSLRGGGRVGA